jgi:endonuclease/exonuclease/phosphatase family metal-dependent hydrolase
MFIERFFEPASGQVTVNDDASAARASTSFKVMQFNMQFGQRWDDKDPDHAPVDIDLTIAAIRAQHADIVLLQEVEHVLAGGKQPWSPPNYTRLRAALADYHGYFAYREADARELPFGIGLAILSKTPLHDRMRRVIPSPPIEFEFNGVKTTPTDRLMIGATTTLAGRKLRIFNTHLLAFFMLNTTGEEPVDQRKLVLEELCAMDGATLIGGDFNVSQHESLVRQFAAAGYKSVQTDEVTWRRRPYVLDHIFCNPHLRALRHAVQPTRASDHHILTAEFEFAD